MAWERRRNGRLFYYRSWRDPATGRVRKEYLGNGPLAEEAAQQVAERAARRQQDREERQRDLALSNHIAEVLAEGLALTESLLLAASYHRPQRKPWRKRRSRRVENEAKES